MKLYLFYLFLLVMLVVGCEDSPFYSNCRMENHSDKNVEVTLYRDWGYDSLVAKIPIGESYVFESEDLNKFYAVEFEEPNFQEPYQGFDSIVFVFDDGMRKCFSREENSRINPFVYANNSVRAICRGLFEFNYCIEDTVYQLACQVYNKKED